MKTKLCIMILCLLISSNCSAMIKKVISNMVYREIKVGTIYQHYKGNHYKVLAIARDSENPELQRVIYQGLYEDPVFGKNPIWDRPYQMFVEEVVIDRVKQARFKEINSKKS